MSNGTEGRIESFHFRHVSNTSLKPRKDEVASPSVKENKIQTREVLQKRISRLEEQLEYIYNSIQDQVQEDIEVA